MGLVARGFVPPIWGTWMGPKSPNNKLPEGMGAGGDPRRKFDFLDLASMAHDIEYSKKGWFALEGDLKYIARLTHNMNRMDLR